MSERKLDSELAAYRDMLKPPAEFREGFGWSTVTGVVFCGLVMLPASIYLGLMTGGSMGSAATWVTLILFNEIARRALVELSPQRLVTLLRAASIVMGGGPMGELVYRAYLVNSEPVRDAGLRGAFPAWYAPAADSAAIAGRQLMHSDWLMPIVLVAFVAVIGLVKRYTLGYFFFRLTSDIEKLPYPLAPVQAQGAMALAEADQGDVTAAAKSLGKPGAAMRGSERWRQFSLGAMLGIAFGIIQVGVPAISGLFLDQPIFLVPQPFLDLTTLTEGILPATPTGIAIDVGVILLGFVLPFWAVVGTFAAIVLTMILNPVLQKAGVLSGWQPGMDTVNTAFANDVDFWLSFGVGAGLGIAAISFGATFKDLVAFGRAWRARRAQRKPGEKVYAGSPPKGRGDYPLWIALVGYCVAAAATVGLAYYLLPNQSSLLPFLIIFAFVYSPFLSYVNARLLGIAGQEVDIPFVRETAFMVSGARGIEVWLAPMPVENFGQDAQAFRVSELCGVRFWSLLKTDLVAIPILFALSFMFWSFIWKANAIPSPAFPAAQVAWEMRAKRDALILSSTLVGEGAEASSMADSEFMRAIKPPVIGAGFGVTVGMYGALSAMGLPVLFVYGMVRGLGQFPHLMVLEIIGALLGRYWLARWLGADRFRRMAPTLLAGYFTGVGLIGMAAIAIRLVAEAAAGSPL